MRLPLSLIGIVVAAALLAPTPALSQQWSWPDKAEDLQVLPKDFDGQQLRGVMRGFSRALGVRCSHCHVGEQGQSFSEYDFVSNDNPNKDRARDMLRMLGDINDHLDKIEPSGPDQVNMWCHTCHRGTARPMRLDEALLETFASEGMEGTIAQYHALRERYYGRGAYDFGEGVLNGLGYHFLGSEESETALALFEINTEVFPESANSWDSLAETHMNLGNTDKAIEFYEKSLSLNPDSQNAVDMLAKLRGETPAE